MSRRYFIFEIHAFFFNIFLYHNLQFLFFQIKVTIPKNNYMNQILRLPVLKYTHRKKKKKKKKKQVKNKANAKKQNKKKNPKKQNSTILLLQEKKRTTTTS